jgi:hypothetical protein
MTRSQYYIEVWRDPQQMPVIGIEEYHLSQMYKYWYGSPIFSDRVFSALV